MTITVGGTSITFNDGTVQTTAAGAPTTAQVLTATAGASVGAVGTYAFLGVTNYSYYTPGQTVAGSTLLYTNAAGIYYTTASGTWRCMGRTQPDAGAVSASTLWLRIS